MKIALHFASKPLIIQIIREICIPFEIVSKINLSCHSTLVYACYQELRGCSLEKIFRKMS